MTQNELATAITSIKLDTLDKYTIYFDRMRIDDRVSSFHQRECLKALDIHIQVLDYAYGIDALNNSDKTAITEDDINNVIEAATAVLRTFKNAYYD